MSREILPNDQLKRLMQKHRLSNVEAGKLLGLSVYADPRRPGTETCPRIASYVADPESSNYRAMPGQLIELLQLKLKQAPKRRVKRPARPR